MRFEEIAEHRKLACERDNIHRTTECSPIKI
jgi:hypothetical protein